MLIAPIPEKTVTGLRPLAGSTLRVLSVLITLAAISITLAAPTSGQGEGPLDFFAAFSRAQLDTAGFQRLEAEVNGQTLVWWQQGNGPTLVMIHGVADQAGTWFQTAPRLAESFRVLLIDLPGHGDSGPHDGPLKMSTVLEGLETWLSSHAEVSPEKPAILVGNSMGAWISSLVALRHPRWVSRLVLVNGGPLKADTGELNLLPANREEARRLMAAIRDPKSPQTPDPILDDLVRRAADGQVRRMLAESEDLESHLLDGRLNEIETATDILWGESDRYMGRQYPDRLNAGLRASRLTLLPSCGHLPQAECPLPFSEALSRLLSSPMPSEPQPAASKPGDSK